MARRGQRARQRKEERKQSHRRNQQLIIAGVVAVAIVFAGIIFALTSIPAQVELPPNLDRYDQFMSGTSDEGYPRLGNPNAPVEVKEYASFSCPGCANFHETIFPQLLPQIAEGAIQFVYVPLRTGDIPNPDGAARTALCAGEQGQFWQMHDVLFYWHDLYGNTAFQDSRLRAGVNELGLNSSQFFSCFDSNATDAIITSAFAEGVGTTPSVAVNGVLLPSATLATITEAISSNLPANASFEPGIIEEEPSTETDAEPTEAVEPETEATEAPEAEAEATESSE